MKATLTQLPSNRFFRARTVYLTAAAWFLVLCAVLLTGNEPALVPGSMPMNILVIGGAVISGFTMAFAVWQVVHWGLPRFERGQERLLTRLGVRRFPLPRSVYVILVVVSLFLRFGWDQRPVVSGIDWLPREVRGGSYLRTLRGEIRADESTGQYILRSGDEFEFKPPDAPARRVTLHRALRVSRDAAQADAIATEIAASSNELGTLLEPRPTTQ